MQRVAEFGMKMTTRRRVFGTQNLKEEEGNDDPPRSMFFFGRLTVGTNINRAWYEDLKITFGFLFS